MTFPLYYPREHPNCDLRLTQIRAMTKAEMCEGIVNHIPFALHRAAGIHKGAAPEPLCVPPERGAPRIADKI